MALDPNDTSEPEVYIDSSDIYYGQDSVVYYSGDEQYCTTSDSWSNE